MVIMSDFSEFVDYLTEYQQTQDLSHLRAAFQCLDTNHDGSLSQEELVSYYISDLGGRKGRALGEAFFRISDTNKDGFIDQEEFVTLVKNILSLNEPAEECEPREQDREFERLYRLYLASRDPNIIEQMFTVIDENVDGVISIEELERSYLGRQSKNPQFAIKMMLAMSDINADNSLSREEFAKMIKVFSSEN